MNRLQKFKKSPLFFIFQAFLLVLLVLTFGALVSVLFCKSCETYISADLLGLSPTPEATTPSSKPEALKFIGIAMGGILVALQALMSYKRAKALEDTAQAQADAVSKTEQGQRQERLKNAIEHLGHDKDSVRLGGVHELFHLAKDTRELRKTVLDILCAHIRQTTSEEEYRKKHKSKPSEEVQSLLTLLFVQEHEVEVFEDLRINFQGSWLNGANLRKARLKKAILVGVNLQKADLCGAQMQGAILVGAQMQGAELAGTQMEKAVLTKAQMQGAMLMWPQMEKAVLTEAQMQGTVLSGTHLQGAMLRGAQMQGAVLVGTHLQDAILEGAQMQGVARYGDSSASFEKRIRERIAKESDLAGAISEDQSIQELMRGATTGSYTSEEAEKWIAEYKEAMSETPDPAETPKA